MNISKLMMVSMLSDDVKINKNNKYAMFMVCGKDSKHIYPVRLEGEPAIMAEREPQLEVKQYIDKCENRVLDRIAKDSNVGIINQYKDRFNGDLDVEYFYYKSFSIFANCVLTKLSEEEQTAFKYNFEHNTNELISAHVLAQKDVDLYRTSLQRNAEVTEEETLTK